MATSPPGHEATRHTTHASDKPTTAAAGHPDPAGVRFDLPIWSQLGRSKFLSMVDLLASNSVLLHSCLAHAGQNKWKGNAGAKWGPRNTQAKLQPKERQKNTKQATHKPTTTTTSFRRLAWFQFDLPNWPQLGRSNLHPIFQLPDQCGAQAVLLGLGACGKEA